jgi:HK97 family phage prohead protease
MSDDVEFNAHAHIPITRSFVLDDLVVRSDGDGRTVEAYAAVFGQPTEISDHFGHYMEVIDRTAFNEAINGRSLVRQKPRVLFNHGRDIYGNPSDRFSMPIGTPETITADTRGLRTVTRIAKTPLGDEVLELMRSGAIDGFSFQGKPIKSQQVAAPSRDELPTIVRQKLGLAEYGPGVFVAYAGAGVLAIRTEQIVAEIDQLTPDQLAELVDVLRSRVPDLATVPVETDARDADETGQPVRAADELDPHRRLMAARLRGLLS